MPPRRRRDAVASEPLVDTTQAEPVEVDGEDAEPGADAPPVEPLAPVALAVPAAPRAPRGTRPGLRLRRGDRRNHFRTDSED